MAHFFILFLPPNWLFDGKHYYPKIGYLKHKYTLCSMDRDKWSARQEFLWKLLRDIRKESNQTQTDLALKLKRRQTYVSKYELGERRLDLLEIYDICNACGVTLIELMERIEPEHQKYAALKG